MTALFRNAIELYFMWAIWRRSIGIFFVSRSVLLAFHPEFDRLFAFGIDPVGGGLPDDQPGDWPSVEDVRRYSARLRETLDEALLRAATEDPALARLENGLLLEVAVEHRLMHTETLCYMLHQLPIGRKHARSDAPARQAPSCVPHSVEIPTGSATLGLRRSPHGPFGWDNEFDEHRVEVPRIRNRCIQSNESGLPAICERGRLRGKIAVER